jgi:NAD(P)H dehydrogenase (quinone)
VNVLILFDTRHGNTHRLALAVVEGAKSVAGAEVKLARAGDTGTEGIPPGANERRKKAHEAFIKLPEATPDDLLWADAVILGSPTRFGNMTAPMKGFIDSTIPIWLQGGLVGKVGACFTSSASMHGGQETTLISMMFPMFHHGMVIVGIPYSEQRLVNTTRGGTPYGAISVSGPAADQGPNEDELELAKALGKRVAEVTTKLRG